MRNLKWQSVEAIHEEGMPYLVWDLDDPATVELMTSIDEYRTLVARMTNPRAMSVRAFFMRGYQIDIDKELAHGV